MRPTSSQDEERGEEMEWSRVVCGCCERDPPRRVLYVSRDD
jgi:hypothetical protein